jgi:ArsR family transcriptional regulator
MTEEPITEPEQALSVERAFRALADSTRVRILHLLRDGPLCVGDLVAVLGVPQPTAYRGTSRTCAGPG